MKAAPRGAALGTLGRDDRPRERLIDHGPAALGDHELLAVLLGAGVRGADALATASALLAAVGGVGALNGVPGRMLMRVPGVGEARAARVLAAVELGRRALIGPRAARPRVSTPAAVAGYLLPRFGGHREERFGVLLLDTKHRVIRALIVSVGVLDASMVHPREVFRAAAEHSAAAVILFHNHPSGDPAPSGEDLLLTRRLVQAGELMGIAVLDHVVLGDACWHSVRESAPGVMAR